MNLFLMILVADVKWDFYITDPSRGMYHFILCGKRIGFAFPLRMPMEHPHTIVFYIEVHMRYAASLPTITECKLERSPFPFR